MNVVSHRVMQSGASNRATMRVRHPVTLSSNSVPLIEESGNSLALKQDKVCHQ